MTDKLPMKNVSSSRTDVEDEVVASELTQILYSNGLTSNFAVLAATAIIFYVFKDKLSIAHLQGWSLYMVGNVVFRLYLMVRYKREDKTTVKHHIFKRYYLIGTAAIALGWTVISALGLSVPSFEYRLYIVLLIVSLSGAAVPVLGSSMLAIYLYILPPAIITVLLLFSHGGMDIATGIALGIFTLMTLRSGKNLYETLLSSITLRIRNQVMAGNLEKVVAERTRELEESRDIAEKANRTKSEFLANMSHEIRTPINGIIHFSRLALSGEMSPESRDFIEKQKSSSTSLLRIINDILDLSKIESGRLNIENIVFSMENLLKESMDVFSISAEEKGLQLKMNLPSNLPGNLKGDPLRVQQVLSNLISNAVKFTQQGEITIDVCEKMGDGEKAAFEFQITDTGIGMTEEQQMNLFQPFQQGDSSTTRKYGGTGLGLVISKNLIERMGGTIAVKSTNGKGTSFTFMLPFEYSDSEADTLETEKFSEIDLTNRMARIRGAEILVAEDNELNQFIITTILESAGFHVTVADNGQEALEQLEVHSFDLVLMDIQMPVMDGFEATKEIRRNKKWAKLPVFAMTANVMQEDINKCLAVGMNAHLCKPLDMEQLNHALAKWILPVDSR
ncbi:MAG: ATP-binding protein [Xanthomonadales bacterium]|nr:ATP-binding protein [Xanthomonadales bacterium]